MMEHFHDCRENMREIFMGIVVASCDMWKQSIKMILQWAVVPPFLGNVADKGHVFLSSVFIN